MQPRRLAIVTGASKGFGRAIAVALAADAAAAADDAASSLPRTALDLLLVGGRDAAGLAETARLCDNAARTDNTEAPPVVISTILADFSQASVTDEVTTALGAIPRPPGEYGAALLVHNAGSLGRLARCRDLSEADIRSAFDVNLVAPAVLTAEFLRRFAHLGGVPAGLTIVNVSSLAALQPFDTWGLYSTSKAGRDIFFKTLAVEENPAHAGPPATNTREDRPGAAPGSPRPPVAVINYAPGPLDTDMQRQIREEMPDVPLRAAFADMKEKNQLVDPRDSALVLLRLLKLGLYSNGDHVDYYDVKDIPEPK
ncbi:hypothetical protein HK405_014976 [Cladochytrium tenue]|nr:hypothetical protein HK405_014976 [Cladochytrium tenue]